SKPKVFNMSLKRTILEGETFHNWGLCSRVQNDKKFVYRMCDDPDDGILVDVPDEELIGLTFIGIHRGIAIYSSQSQINYHYSVRRLRENIIIIEAAWRSYPKVFVRDSDQFIYMTLCDSRIIILDTYTMEFLPVLHIENISKIWLIAGLFNGEITVKGTGAVIGAQYLV
ncbi:hypothetical protein PMAYCL1PPCAC_09412, partial [Pristionchus mayeri]